MSELATASLWTNTTVQLFFLVLVWQQPTKDGKYLHMLLVVKYLYFPITPQYFSGYFHYNFIKFPGTHYFEA